MSKKNYHTVLKEGVYDCDWNENTQLSLCLDYMYSYLDFHGILKFKNFIVEKANDEIEEYDIPNSNFMEKSIYLENIIDSSSQPKKENPSTIFKKISGITGWNEATQLNLVLQFLESQYMTKIGHFECIISEIIDEEIHSSIINYHHN